MRDPIEFNPAFEAIYIGTKRLVRDTVVVVAQAI
jgi:hypothetical protein